MKTYVVILLSIAASVGIIFTLLLSAELPNRKTNGFNRVFIEGIAQPLASHKFDIQVKAIYYADESNIFFTTDTNGLLLKSNQFLNKMEREEFISNDNFHLTSKNSRTFVTDNQICIIPEGRNELTCICLNGKSNKTHSLPYTPEYVTSPKSEVLLFRTRKKNKISFFSFNLHDQSIKTGEEINLALDSTLYADGQLISDPVTNSITYVPYYHNSVITFDTAFNTIGKFRTIDTLSHDIIALKNTKRAPLVINQKSTSYNGLLFIASNLKADNEPLTTYRKKIPIDVYDNSTGEYQKSFYIPLSNGKLIKSFLVLSCNVLIVLYHDNSVSSFRLDFANLIGNN